MTRRNSRSSTVTKEGHPKGKLVYPNLMYAEGRTMMKKETDDTIQILNLSQRLLGFFAIVGLVVVMLTKTTADAQVAGSSTLGVTTDEIKVVMLGWSVLCWPAHEEPT